MKQVRGRALALGVAAMLGAWGTGAQAITYNVTIVQFETGTEQFDGENTVGSVLGNVFSSNLPIPLTTSTANYTGMVGQGSLSPLNGAWTLSDGNGSDLSGTFQNLERFGNMPGMPLMRGTGTTTIGGGTGAFENASGSGTFEVFARDYFGDSGPAYQQVVVNRMQITLPDGPEQTDTRNVVVSVRVGVNDGNTMTGQNVGGPTSDDADPALPRLTNLLAQYEYAPPLPHQGRSESRNAAGDAQYWEFLTNESRPLTDYFWFAQGSAQMVSGEGFYAGYTADSEWMAFESWMTQLSPNLFTYSNVVIDRYTLAPIPEPETYALMLAGLAFVGFAARRRRLLR
jgi:hypothetical protein